MTSQVTQHQYGTFHNPQFTSVWQKTFAIPELRSHVATFLDTKDILTLVLTCRHWHRIWRIELFTEVVLHFPPSPHLLTMLGTYGHHVRTLKLKLDDCGAYCARILDQTPNTRSLDLSVACLSVSQMEEIVSVAPASLQNLRFSLEQAGAVARDELFVLLARLVHLRSVWWAGVDVEELRVIHVDDILLVLEACPQLTELFLGCVEIMDSDPVPNSSDLSGGSVAALHTANLDTSHRCAVGRRIHELELNLCVASDESLLRLLGIRPADQDSSAAHLAHPLVRLNLNMLRNNTVTVTVTSRSVNRILQECGGAVGLLSGGGGRSVVTGPAGHSSSGNRQDPPQKAEGNAATQNEEERHGQTELHRLRAQVGDLVRQQADLLKQQGDLIKQQAELHQQQHDSRQHNLRLERMLAQVLQTLKKED
ncbi:hypothetical protein BG000_001173 [Podila horticola]|nr:hypothetical protein BG000_001173 [Podila horticola]